MITQARCITIPNPEGYLVSTSQQSVINTDWNSDHVGLLGIHTQGMEDHYPTGILATCVLLGVYHINALIGRAEIDPGIMIGDRIPILSVVEKTEAAGPYVWVIADMVEEMPTPARGTVGRLWDFSNM